MKEFFPLAIAGALAWFLYSRNTAAVADNTTLSVVPGPGTNPVVGTNPVRGVATPIIYIPSGGGAMANCPTGRVCQVVQLGGGPCTTRPDGVMECPQ